MANETVITVIGNLTADPELRTLQNGANVVNFTIAATPRTFNRQTNQWENGAALFMRCTAWNELASNIAGTCTMGLRFIALGILRQRSNKENAGSDRSVIELTVNEIGPSLRYATAQVSKNNQNGGQQGQPAQPQPQQQQNQQQHTNWSNQQAGYSAQGFNNEPAF